MMEELSSLIKVIQLIMLSLLAFSLLQASYFLSSFSHELIMDAMISGFICAKERTCSTRYSHIRR